MKTDFIYIPIKLKSANHQKSPTQNMKGRQDKTDDRKRQGQHKKTSTNIDRHGQDRQFTQPTGQIENKHHVGYNISRIYGSYSIKYII